MIYEILGYAASALIAISLMMSSVIKLRIYGLVGALLFTVYGFLIGSLPVGFLNLFNVFIHIYYLAKARNKKEYFKILEVKPENNYLLYFLDFYKEKLKTFFPYFEYEPEAHKYLSFFIVRNLAVAGIFIGKESTVGKMEVILDFVVPEYRDFKVGDFLFRDNIDFFKEKNIKQLYCKTTNQTHVNYLKKMKFKLFEEDHEKIYVLNID